MSKFIFTQTFENEDEPRVIVTSREVYLPSLLEDIETFLKACGFVLKGPLEIVEAEDVEDQD